MATTQFKNIHLTDITPDPNQPRKFIDQESLTELTESIRTKGVIQPIVVRENAAGTPHYMIVCGERRYKASVLAGTVDIPAIIRELSDRDAMELQIIENLQRRDVHPMEEAIAFAQLSETFSNEEIALRVGKNVRFVTNRICLTDLCEQAQQLFYDGHMTLHQALILVRIDQDTQQTIINERLPDDWTENKTNYPDWNIGNVEYIVHRKFNKLNGEYFDPTNDKIYPEKGACTGCQYNSANNPTLFDEGQEPLCTNSTCFSIKKEKHFDATLQAEMSLAGTEFRGVVMGKHTYDFGNNIEVPKQILAKYKVDVIFSNSLKEIEDPGPLLTPEEWEEEEDWMIFNEVETIDSDEFRTEYEEYKTEQLALIAEYQDTIKTATKMPYVDYSGVISNKYFVADKGSFTPAVSGGSISSEIDLEISKIKAREIRAKELDSEKIYEAIRQQLLSSEFKNTFHNDFDRTAEPTIRRVITALLYNELDYTVKYEYDETFFKKRHPNVDVLAKHFLHSADDDVDYIFKEVLTRFIWAESFKPGGSENGSLRNAASIRLAEYLAPIQVMGIRKALNQKAEARSAKVESRIKALTI